MIAKCAVAVAAAVALTACATTPPGPAVTATSASPTAPQPAPSMTWPPASCGTARWPVKTGTDSTAGQVSLHTQTPATIAELSGLTPPAALPQDSRVPPAEITVYRVTGTLVQFRQEGDSDYHLVISDHGQTMITEIPDPYCVGASSPFLPYIETARAGFDARYQVTGQWQQPDAQVTVTGVGFFDYLHGQTGAAPNGIELHPVLDVQFGS